MINLIPLLIFLIWYLCIMIASGLICYYNRIKYKIKYSLLYCYCDNCHKQLLFIDSTFPIFSYIWLNGKTRCCNYKLDFKLVLNELFIGTIIFLMLIFI